MSWQDEIKCLRLYSGHLWCDAYPWCITDNLCCWVWVFKSHELLKAWWSGLWFVNSAVYQMVKMHHCQISCQKRKVEFRSYSTFWNKKQQVGVCLWPLDDVAAFDASVTSWYVWLDWTRWFRLEELARASLICLKAKWWSGSHVNLWFLWFVLPKSVVRGVVIFSKWRMKAR